MDELFILIHCGVCHCHDHELSVEEVHTVIGPVLVLYFFNKIISVLDEVFNMEIDELFILIHCGVCDCHDYEMS